jgi:hypothetical protein
MATLSYPDESMTRCHRGATQPLFRFVLARTYLKRRYGTRRACMTALLCHVCIKHEFSDFHESLDQCFVLFGKEETVAPISFTSGECRLLV